jgi:hypothetical protein
MGLPAPVYWHMWSWKSVAVFLNITSCSLYVSRRLGGTYQLHLACRFIPWLIFDFDDGGDIFVWNVPRYIQEVHNCHNYRRENLKWDILFVCFYTFKEVKREVAEPVVSYPNIGSNRRNTANTTKLIHSWTKDRKSILCATWVWVWVLRAWLYAFWKSRFLSQWQISDYVRFGSFTAVTMKNGVFWDTTPRISCKSQRFGGTQLLHHQGDKNRWIGNNVVRF